MVKTRKNQKKQRGGFFGFFNKPEPQPQVAPLLAQNTKASVVAVPTKTPEQLAFQQKEADIRKQIAEKRLAEQGQDDNAKSAYITKFGPMGAELKVQLKEERQKTPPYMGGNRKSKRKSRKSRKNIKKSKNNKR
jgi:hypothetical protein